MLKKFLALGFIFLLALSGTSFAAATDTTTNYTNYTNSDPFHLSLGRDSGKIISDDITSYFHSLYGYGDTDFFYQLRDITGAARTSKVAGPQWFATVYENYSRLFATAVDTTTTTNTTTTTRKSTTSRGAYRRTMGGETDEVPFTTVGDLLDGFSFVFAEEPEPYQAWLNRNLIDSDDYDVFPDPLETLCVVTYNGNASMTVKFANPFARHFPFWWNWSTTALANRGYWWQDTYKWQDTSFFTVESVAYIYDTSDDIVYARGDDGRYAKIYSRVLSYDVTTTTSGDETITTRSKYRYYIEDTSGKNLYVSSGDINASRLSYVSGDNVVCVVSGDSVYDGSNNLLYTSEHALLRSGLLDSRYVYLCGVRNVAELITVDGLDGYDYNVRVSPNTEREIASNSYLTATININGDSQYYGSKLAYISFKQRASFMPGYTNFREVSPIPFVIANVSNGNAAENPLIFDMTVFDPTTNSPVKRIKFKWDAQSDKVNQDLGTFFTMQQLNATTTKLYNLETKITNRTGTRYELYRYDRVTPGSGSFVSILPKCWKYDLTPDVYGTLPEKFWLDAHSQIAPGLVTVYDENIGPGYGNIDMASDTSASFRLYEYESANPKNLRLNYKRVAGMQVAGNPLARVAPNFSVTAADDTTTTTASDDLVTVQTFTMYFTDVMNNQDQTEREIQTLTDRTPVMADYRYDGNVQPYSVYINSSAMNAFAVSHDVPHDDTGANVNLLGNRVSYDIIPIYAPVVRNESGDATSPDVIGEYYTTSSSKRMAVQPIKVRMKIPRESQLLNGIWESLDSAEDSKTVFDTFAKAATVWVRSSATSEYDADLFKAITNKGNSLGVSAKDCVSAFIYEDYLYLDFMVLMADAVSKNTNKTAFVEIFKDDGVPYILIGDGNIDRRFDLSFYVSAPRADAAGNSSSTSQTTETATTGSSGGSGCNSGFAFVPCVLLGLVLRRKF
ncbi:MAG: hypothetical protein IJU31_03280 [Synergistaceae bacterium]|nr:hypothetical protein [Synergistaceae bacterium]